MPYEQTRKRQKERQWRQSTDETEEKERRYLSQDPRKKYAGDRVAQAAFPIFGVFRINPSPEKFHGGVFFFSRILSGLFENAEPSSLTPKSFINGLPSAGISLLRAKVSHSILLSKRRTRCIFYMPFTPGLLFFSE